MRGSKHLSWAGFVLCSQSRHATLNLQGAALLWVVGPPTSDLCAHSLHSIAHG